jgi:predicted Zn-dependent peptidase
LWDSLERLKEEGVEEAELARAQKIVKAQTVQGLAKNFFRGLLVGLFQLKTGDARRINDILGFYDAVRREDLTRVAKAYLHEDNRTVVTLKPVSPEESQSLGALS